jgi:hypothetical protein
MKKVKFLINNKEETAYELSGVSIHNSVSNERYYYDTNQLIELAIGFNAYDSNTNTINLNVLGSSFGAEKGKWKNNSGYGFISAKHKKANIEFIVHENRNYRY